MFQFGSELARKAPAFIPDDDARSWIAEGLSSHARKLGPVANRPQLIVDPMGRSHVPGGLDDLFELICGVQEQIGQDDVEFTLLEVTDRPPALPEGFAALGDPTGQMLHGFAREDEFALLFSPALFRLKELLYASVARELGRMAIYLHGGHDASVERADFEGDAELASVTLGMGVWVANGAYVFENSCCGGGCGVDLRSIRTGLSLPEAAFATALDAQRKGIGRRMVAKHLEPTQRAAFKQAWNHCAKNEHKALAAASSRGELEA